MANQWKTGLFDCTDDLKLCMCGTFCEPCLLYENGQKLNGPDGPWKEHGIWYVVTWIFAPCVPFMFLRNKVRQKYDIEGTDMEDIGAGLLCGACVNCQVARELRDNREEEAAKMSTMAAEPV